MTAFGFANGAMALLFVGFAALQWNDPDPVPWIAIYGAAAAACVVARRARRGWIAAALVGLAALVWSATLVPTVIATPPAWRDIVGDMQMKAAGVEEARELMGLGIVAAWMAAVALVRDGRRRAAS